MNIGLTIVTLRKQAGLSQGALAEACGLSQSYLSQIEKNKKSPHLDTLEKISETLEVPLPVMVFLALRQEDIPDSKKDSFNLLFPSIRALLIDFFPKSKVAIKPETAA